MLLYPKNIERDKLHNWLLDDEHSTNIHYREDLGYILLGDFALDVGYYGEEYDIKLYLINAKINGVGLWLELDIPKEILISPDNVIEQLEYLIDYYKDIELC